MPKKYVRKTSAGMPTEPLLMGLGLASLLRDETYHFLSHALEQTKWIGMSGEQIQAKLRTAGKKEYARLIKDVERSLNVAMRSAKKPLKKKR